MCRRSQTALLRPYVIPTLKHVCERHRCLKEAGCSWAFRQLIPELWFLVLPQGKALMAMNGDRRPVMQLSRMLRLREANMLRGGCAGGFSAAQRCHIPGFLYRPNQPVGLIDRMCSRAYIGQFSGNGDVFVGKETWSIHALQSTEKKTSLMYGGSHKVQRSYRKKCSQSANWPCPC